MSYIELPSGSQALLADVLQCCLFQRKYRTPLTASVGPDSLFFVGKITVYQRKGLLWYQRLLGLIFKLGFPPFDERFEEEGEREANFDSTSSRLLEFFCRFPGI